MARFCGECGTALEEGARFCGNCGAPVEADPPAPPSPPARSLPAPETPAPVTPTPTAPPPRPGPSPTSRGFFRWSNLLVVLIGVAVAFWIVFPDQAARLRARVVARLAEVSNQDAPRSAPAQPRPPVATPQPAARPTQQVSASTPAGQVRPAVTDFSLAPIATERAPDGLRVSLHGAFTVSGLGASVPGRGVGAWREGRGPVQYGAGQWFSVTNGRNTVSTTLLIPQGATSGASYTVYLAVRIGNEEYLSPPTALAVQVVAGDPSPRATSPGPAPLVPAPPVPVPPVPAPTPAPNVTSQPPSSAPAVSRLQLAATSSVQVGPGETVSFNLSFYAADSVSLENTVAWREPDGSLRYGNFTSYRAAAGLNTLRGLSFRPSTGAAPGTSYTIYGVLRVSGQLYRTQVPLVITVVGRAQAPGPNAPPVPVTTPAPPPTARMAPVEVLDWAATGPTFVPQGGRVSFTLTFAFIGDDQASVEAGIGWTDSSGQNNTGPLATLPVRRGTNTIAATFNVGNAQPGAVFQVYGLVRFGGVTYRSGPVTVTVRP